MEKELEKKVLKIIKSYEQFAEEILPQAGKLVFDIGNLNKGLLLCAEVRTKAEL